MSMILLWSGSSLVIQITLPPSFKASKIIVNTIESDFEPGSTEI